MTRIGEPRELPPGLKLWIAVGALVLVWAVLLGTGWLVVHGLAWLLSL